MSLNSKVAVNRPHIMKAAIAPWLVEGQAVHQSSDCSCPFDGIGFRSSCFHNLRRHNISPGDNQKGA
jgi:hypothetical protein